MIQFSRTNSENEDFRTLVRELDADLRIRDGKDHAFYSQFNKIDKIRNVIVAYDNELAVGCGAFKEYDPSVVEIKRMFVLPDRRGQGIASVILKELEQWAIEMNYRLTLLETGIRQPEAIALYKKNGYRIIPNFGQYENIKNSVCFEKTIVQ
jgi:putative acetyltransferase